MTMTTCADCGASVSSRAASCPQCGAPIAQAREQAATGTPLTTTQATSKKFKLHYLLAWALMIVGGMWLMMAVPEAAEPDGGGTIPVIMLVAGFAWLLVTKFRVWWHHK